MRPRLRWLASALAALPLAVRAALPPPAAPGEGWISRGTAELVLLDKVNARTTPLEVKTGETVRHGSLTITVRACLVSGPDQPKDAAVFLDIADSRPGAPGFHGWMLVDAPFVSGLEHPVYDVRPMGCR